MLVIQYPPPPFGKLTADAGLKIRTSSISLVFPDSFARRLIIPRHFQPTIFNPSTYMVLQLLLKLSIDPHRRYLYFDVVVGLA
jgi:hypothetical protein